MSRGFSDVNARIASSLDALAPLFLLLSDVPKAHIISKGENSLNILCLDGGGVRGLSALLILRELMQQLKNTSNLPEVPLPCDIFDMICGTSTGGLIALMLGRLRMSVQDTIDEYMDFCGTVFREGSKGQAKEDNEQSIYDSSKLQEWVMNMVSRNDASKKRDAHLEDSLGKDNCCRTFVVTASQIHATSPPKLFRSYSTCSCTADTCEIWEAARATTAAFPFFEAAKIGFPGEKFIDGSFSGSNNPSMRAIEEIHDAFPSGKIACFLSIGTGVPKVISAAGGHKEVAEACMALIQSCERTHDEVGRAFYSNRVPAYGESYFRFSVNRGLEDIELDEWNRVEELTAITNGCMRYHDQEKAVKKCLGKLVSRASMISMRQGPATLPMLELD